MSSSVVLSDLSWSTPEGQPLLSHVELSFGPERTGLVGRNGVGKTTLLKLIAGEAAPLAGTVAVSGSLGVLRQAVQPGPGETIADLFGAADGLALLCRAERGEAGAEEVFQADWTLPARLGEALARVGLTAGAEISPETPLAALSGGQATRVRLAALTFAEPDFLILDEPTNNLDREGRRAVIGLLAGWRGGAIVVSHDRELLETMDAIVELTALGARRYGGNWSRYRERKAAELAAARRDLGDAQKRLAAVERKAQEAVERKARKDGVAKRKRAKGDMPRILMNARKASAENTGGGEARLAERQRAEALGEAGAARQRIEILTPFSLVLPPTGLPEGRTVLALEDVTFGHVPERPIIENLSLAVVGPERVAVTGPNGSGKTTLLALATGALRPQRGSVLLAAGAALLDQRAALLNPAASIRDNFRRLNPDAGENACRSALARFMFRADAALQTVASLSGGEMLRAALACVLGSRPPALLILDEPTNHLDIASIEIVEAGLCAYDGALMVVSHDEAFLEAIGVERRLELPAGASESPSRP